MSFGFSVGDFIAVLQIVNDVRRRFVDAPHQFKAISDDVKVLSNVLRDIEDIDPDQRLSDQQKNDLNQIAQGCRDVLNELKDRLDDFQDLGVAANGLREKSKRIWERATWNNDEIAEFRSRIEASVDSFTLFPNGLNNRISLATRTVIENLNRRQNEQQQQKILDWLSPVSYASQQGDFLNRRQDGTGQWLLETDEFQHWILGTKQILFCPGIPGAGKTILTSVVVDHLERKFQDDSHIGIAYLYCNFKLQGEQTTFNLLASLLKQLGQVQATIPSSVTNMYEKHEKRQSRPQFPEIVEALHGTAKEFKRKFIIIDALDECSNSTRKKLLEQLFRLQDATGVNLFVTSRYILDIENKFEGRSTFLEIRANSADVRTYLDAHMFKLPLFVNKKPDLQQEICDAIIEAVDGMFLLAHLYPELLIGLRSAKVFKTALQKLPKGDDVYDYAYGEAMERIKGQREGSCTLAMDVLSWICCAKRPLTTTELQHALAVEIEEDQLDGYNFPEVEDMVSVCAGLVTIDQGSNIIRLIHYTVQEYFERNQELWFPHAHEDIARICIAYLSLEEFRKGACPTSLEFQERLGLYSLVDYSSLYWGDHVSGTAAETEHWVINFLNMERNVESAVQTMTVSKNMSQSLHNHRKYPSDVFEIDLAIYFGFIDGPRDVLGIHLAAFFGLNKIVAILLEDGYDPDHRDSHGKTPLMWAAERNKEEVIELFYTYECIINCQNKSGETALIIAAQH